MKPKSTSKREVALWRITRIAGARGQQLGEIQAEAAEAAIDRYAREFRVDKAARMRLAAYRLCGADRLVLRCGPPFWDRGFRDREFWLH
jgi:hypothetical protein